MTRTWAMNPDGVSVVHKLLVQSVAKAPNADGSMGVLALTPFLSQPVDVSILDRYELSKISSTRIGGRVEWIVQKPPPFKEHEGIELGPLKAYRADSFDGLCPRERYQEAPSYAKLP